VPDPGNPVAWNRFAYVYNNPVNYTDPSGHAPVLLAAAYTVVDTAWDIADVYSDIRDCFGDSDSMACAMLPIDALAVVALFAEGPSNNVARRTAKAADAGDGVKLLPAPPERKLLPAPPERKLLPPPLDPSLPPGRVMGYYRLCKPWSATRRTGGNLHWPSIHSC